MTCIECDCGNCKYYEADYCIASDVVICDGECKTYEEKENAI